MESRIFFMLMILRCLSMMPQHTTADDFALEMSSMPLSNDDPEPESRLVLRPRKLEGVGVAENDEREDEDEEKDGERENEGEGDAGDGAATDDLVLRRLTLVSKARRGIDLGTAFFFFAEALPGVISALQ